MRIFRVFTVLYFLFICTVQAQDQTTGLFQYDPATAEGYVLFHPFRATTTYLVDNCGREIHRWESSYNPAASVYLLPNGRLLRTAVSPAVANPLFQQGGMGNRVQILDWDGKVEWEFVYSDSTVCLHHDIEPMPNGHVLMLAWERHTYEEAIAAGRRPDLLPDSVVWSEQIIEVNPATSEIVWKWRLWDHLVQDYDPTKANFGTVRSAPGKLDINFTGGPTAGGGADWFHANSIAYNPQRDEIMINSPFLDEFYVIDHSTTTAQAATSRGGRRNAGGDFLYRWGNPQVYRQGGPADRKLFAAHDAQWIAEGLQDAGRIMVFNNGDGQRPYSTIDLIDPPVDDYLSGNYVYIPNTAFLPRRPFWQYGEKEEERFFSSFISGAQRLPNGNTLVCSGEQGRFFEINSSKEIVWDYVNPIAHQGPLGRSQEIPVVGGRNANIVFRSLRYAPDFPGFAGKKLLPRAPLELDAPDPYPCSLSTSRRPALAEAELSAYPSPAREQLFLEAPGAVGRRLRVFDAVGRQRVQQIIDDPFTVLEVASWPPGMYTLLVDGWKGVRIFVQ